MKWTFGTVVVLMLVAAPAASAATARMEGGAVAFDAERGERNEVRVSIDSGRISVRDSNPITAGEGCTNRGEREVLCGESGIAVPNPNCWTLYAECDGSYARFRLGDRADAFTTDGSRSVGLVLVEGGGGPDRLAAGDAGYLPRLLGGAGDDEITAAADNPALLKGDSGADRLSGAAGQDALIGGPGQDTLLGGHGSDALSGGGGPDYMRGGAGDDQLVSGGGADFVKGEDGSDWVSYAGVKSRVRVTLDGAADDGAAGEGDNVQVENVIGGSGADKLVGDKYRNHLDGGRGDDLILGGDWDDRLVAGPGADRLRGGRGNDALSMVDMPGPDLDAARCGAGDDEVFHDSSDSLSEDCEKRSTPGPA